MLSLVVEVTLEVVLQLHSKGRPVLLNEVSRNEGEVSILVLPLLHLLQLPELFLFFLHYTVVKFKILVYRIAPESFPLLVQFVEPLDLRKELFLLFQLKLSAELVVLHLLSHLPQVSLHDLLVAGLVASVHLLAELHNVGGVDGFVTELSNALISRFKRLGIRVCHVETFQLGGHSA